MKKFLIGLTTAAVAISLFVVPAFAKDSDNHDNGGNDNNNKSDKAELHLDWQKEVNPTKCPRQGDPIINVAEKVKNDADSGLGGYWAFDNYVRHITVWSSGDSKFCGIVVYEGKFNAVEGQKSPGNTGVVGKNVTGEFEGGYRTTVFTGTLLATPGWPTHGSVGTVDYACDIAGNCPGHIDWTTKYFSSTSGFNLDWWGWIYHADDDHGTWINAITGNFGDIL